MDFQTPEHWDSIRAGVREVCERYGGEYWRRLDRERGFPVEFVAELSRAGWLSTMIPVEYGGGGMGLAETSIVLEEVNRSGANAGTAHAQVYIMGVLLRHASDALKREYLPRVAAGELRLQSFAVTEPEAGSDTTRIRTTAVRRGDTYVINGDKIFISRVLQSDLMLVLARTTPLAELEDRTRGLSLFLVDLRNAGDAVDVRPLRVMMNNHTNAVTFRDLEVPADHMVGEEGNGFRCVIDSWNAERILIAGECIGDGRWFIDGRSHERTSGWCSTGPSARIRGCSSPSRRRTRTSRPPTWCATRRPPGSTRGCPAARRRTWPSCWRRRRRGRRPTSAWTPTAATASWTSTTWSASSGRRGCTPSRRSTTTLCSRTSGSVC